MKPEKCKYYFGLKECGRQVCMKNRPFKFFYGSKQASDYCATCTEGVNK